MSSTYETYSIRERSEKVTLCHVEPLERLLLWTLDSGSVYYRDVDYFTIDVREGTTSLTEGSSSSLSSGEWFYNSSTGRLYIRTSDDTNPNTKNVNVKYRLFFSTGPFSLPCDLSAGPDVYYEPRLKDASAVNKQLDDEQIGIALESSTNLSFYNTDGYFDEIIDSLIWENKTVRVWSWSPGVALSEKKLLFKGTIEDKGFSDSRASFRCKDAIYKLREPFPLERFSVSDGTVPDAYLDTPKRQVYGQFDNLQCVPIDAIKSGYSITGTVSGNVGSASITGLGTSFLDEISPGDELTWSRDVEPLTFTVASVNSDTSLTLDDELEDVFTSVSVTNKPARPWRKKNREWHIAGHKLREPTTVISAVAQDNRVTVSDSTDFEEGDLIDVNGENAYIRRVFGSDIVLEQNLGSTPSVSDPVTKNPISQAYIKTREAFIDRDWTVTNGTTDSKIVFTDTAERNVARPKLLSGSFTFTNGSRTVSVSSKDAQNEMQTRDWIKSDNISHTTYYEILSVDESEIVLRAAYAGGTNTGGATVKNVELISDESLITVSGSGLERSNTWIKAAGSIVNDILQQEIGITDVDAAAITEADQEAPYKMSLIIPEALTSEPPIVRDVIKNINESVFGSLVNDGDFNLVYRVLHQDKPPTLSVLNDDDIIGFSQRFRNKTYSKVKVKYRPFVDIFIGENTFKFYEFSSDFTSNFVEASDELEKTIHLYDENDAQSICQRYALYHSLSTSTISISSKMNLMTKNLGDKLWLSLDRLAKRFGNRDRQKIGVITKISKNGDAVSVDINDLGNTFSRVMSIAPNTVSDYTSADGDERLFNAYVCDNSLEVPDISSDKELGTNLIG